MAPTPNVDPNNQQVTGQEDELAVLRQFIAEEVARTQQTNPQAPSAAPVASPQNNGISLNLGGQVFNFNNQEELNRAVNGMVGNFQSQISALQTQNAAPAGNGTEVSGNDELPNFDMNTFVDQMTKDPRAAFDYVDKYRFNGVNPVEAVQEFSKAKEDLNEIKQVLSVYQFKDAHPEYQGTPQSAAVIEQIRRAAGFNWDLAGLEASYALALQRGLIGPTVAQTQQFPAQGGFQGGFPQGGFPQNPYGGVDPRNFNGGMNFAPPSVPRAAGGMAPDVMSMAEQMTPEQIEAVFARFQQ